MLREWIREELERRFAHQGERGLIVWYDPGGTLESVVQKALPEGVRLLRFEGSFLALRFTLEGEDPDFAGRWLVYVPRDPPEPSWLRDWELLGERLDMDLLGLLQRRCGLATTLKLADLLRGRPENAKALAERWHQVPGDREVTEETLIEALLALCFCLPRWEIHEAVLIFVTEEGWEEKLQAHGLWNEWRRKIGHWLGWPEVPEEGPILKERLRATILLSELVSFVPELSPRWPFLPTDRDRRDEMARLAHNWREREPLREAYRTAALKIEREHELRRLLTVGERILEMETFRVLDELWQEAIRSAVAQDGGNFGEKAARLEEIAKTRQGLFWAKTEERFGKFWEALYLSVQLHRGSGEALTELEGIGYLEDLISRYTAENGWWRLDLWALELAAFEDALAASDAIRFLHPALRIYAEFLDRVNRAFARAVDREGWQPTQVDFWRRARAERGRTAVFLADALRYDLAQYLKQLLAAEASVEMKPVLAMVPSITELGMAALISDPNRLTLTVEEDRLAVRAGEESICGAVERRAYLDHRLGQTGKVALLENLEREELERVQTLVVLCREVDEYGTFVADLHPSGLLEMVRRIARGVRYVMEKGFERVYIAADHGFLFVPTVAHLNSVPAPQARICKRRFAIGGTSEGCINKRASEIGLEGSTVFSFPVGLSVFAMPGERGAFLHGGLSLQECVVAELKGRSVSPVRKVRVEIILPERLTSRVALIEVRAVVSSLFDEPRRIQLAIGEQKSFPVELGPEKTSEQFRLRWLDDFSEPPRRVTVRLQDADTGEILEERTVEVEIVV